MIPQPPPFPWLWFIILTLSIVFISLVFVVLSPLFHMACAMNGYWWCPVWWLA